MACLLFADGKKNRKKRRVEGDDLHIELTMAKALGGSGDRGKTNPEELFAAGYGACFQSAMNAVAPGVLASSSSTSSSTSSSSSSSAHTHSAGQADRSGLDTIEHEQGTGGVGGKKGSKNKMPTDPEDSVVDTTVHLVGDMQALDMGLRVDMRVGVRGIPRAATEEIVRRALEICPYSRAIKGNVTTNVEVVDLDHDDGGGKGEAVLVG
ncbi:OsmC/Ohr family [Xylariaceae sp. FL0594]|nr:OsmC/Ohr family [Xylariaceae sp. FL0594]